MIEPEQDLRNPQDVQREQLDQIIDHLEEQNGYLDSISERQ
jgi:hypothetical protein